MDIHATPSQRQMLEKVIAMIFHVFKSKNKRYNIIFMKRFSKLQFVKYDSQRVSVSLLLFTIWALDVSKVVHVHSSSVFWPDVKLPNWSVYTEFMTKELKLV